MLECERAVRVPREDSIVLGSLFGRQLGREGVGGAAPEVAHGEGPAGEGDEQAPPEAGGS